MFDRVIGAPTILSELKDLPVLKKLTLWLPIIKMVDLENIHNNIPSIEVLCLDRITVEAGDMPSTIIPATLITKLEFDYFNTRSIEAHTQFYQYITKKYTNITYIEYQDRTLESYESCDKRHIYVNGVLDFFKLIGPIKKELTLFGVPDSVNPFKVLDTADCKIKHLCFSSCESGTLFQHLSLSNQSKQVEKFTIQNTRPGWIEAIKSMLALTELFISSNAEDALPVNMEYYLIACPPSLKTLSIISYRLIVKHFQVTLNFIETLCIYTKELGSDLGDIISSCFPNLVELNLGCSLVNPINIKLRSPRFQRATILIRDGYMNYDAEYGISFKSPAQPEPEYYICSTEEIDEVQYEDIEDLPIISIESFTDKKLSLIDGINVVPF